MDRQRMLMIFGAAWVSAALLTWFLYSSTKAPKVEKTVPIQAAARDLPAGSKLRKEDLKIVRVTERDLPKSAITDEKQAIDRPLLYPVTANEAITSQKIAGTSGAEGLPASIEVGKRAIAVPLNDTSGVAGLIQPRAHVDVLFTKSATATDAVTTTILEDVVVLAMGRNTETTNSSSTAPTAAQVAAARPAQSATLLVTPEQARKLELAKNQGKISLALRNPLDKNVASDSSQTSLQALYGGKMPFKQAGPPPAPAEKPRAVLEAEQRAEVEKAVQKALQEAKEKAPPKPKNVIDVYRGDKHVQETFQ